MRGPLTALVAPIRGALRIVLKFQSRGHGSPVKETLVFNIEETAAFRYNYIGFVVSVKPPVRTADLE